MSGVATRRVAILGGGQAALTAALQLTDPGNPAAEHTEVTIYQLGWRLGGKGATGRPDDGPARILEHGLHEWFGFYDNSFRQIRGVYDELCGRPGRSLLDFDHAFIGGNEGFLVEYCEGRPLLWKTEYRTNPGKPGEGGAWLRPLEYIAEAIEALTRTFERSPLAGLGHADDRVLARAHALLDAAAHGHRSEVLSAQEARHLLHAAAAIARAAADGVEHPAARLVDRLTSGVARDLPRDIALPGWLRAIESIALRALAGLLWLFMTVLWRAVRRDIQTLARTEERRLWIQANFAYGCIVGAICDDVVEAGFDVINELDLRDWLSLHAYDDGNVMLDSPIVEAVYQGCFAYPAGDTRGSLSSATAENIEAGTALRGIVRTMFGYKGALVYRFGAGTADTCYAPIYEVLRARGVDVRFFSRVERVELGADGRVARVRVAEQAQIAGAGPYAPLVDIAGLPCWPLQPRWEQLVDGAWFREQGADFEWPSAAVRAREHETVLEDGRDFDDVVLGISIAALEPICGELVARYPAWATALEKIRTVRTQSLQLWLAQPATALGFPEDAMQLTPWRFDERSPLNVWGDFSELIAMEHWPTSRTPASLAYFTSTMPDAPEDFADQGAADAWVRASAMSMLGAGLPVILPGVCDEQGEFRWELLVDPDAGSTTGPERLRTQWIRANVLPSERYVLSVVGSSKYRLAVHDEHGPPNLFLAGDWTQCTLNCGCMEAATISGMLCSHAVCGYPPRAAIVGVDF
jgi:uncharacterized protein with NAD-binding domain and iron-sulfur cluster